MICCWCCGVVESLLVVDRGVPGPVGLVVRGKVVVLLLKQRDDFIINSVTEINYFSMLSGTVG
jgi:hypothetical protein